MATLSPITVFACKSQQCAQHVPHLMQCVKCLHRWIDCPGEAGVNYKNGCGKCGSIYWTAESARNAGKLKELIKQNRVN